MEGSCRRQRPAREQERISGQERRDDEPGLEKDDGEEQPVDPGAVRVGELSEMPVEVQEDVDDRGKQRNSPDARESGSLAGLD